MFPPVGVRFEHLGEGGGVMDALHDHLGTPYRHSAALSH